MKRKKRKSTVLFLFCILLLLLSGDLAYADEGAGDVYTRTSSAYCYDALPSEKEKQLYSEVSKILEDCYALKTDPVPAGPEHDKIGSGYYIIDKVDLSEYSGLSGEQIADSYLSAVYDHPMAFFVSQTVFYGSDLYVLTEDGFGDKDSIESYRNKLETAVKEIAANASDAETDIEKALLIHDAICDMADYSYKEDGTPADDVYAHSISGLIFNGKMVCEGYAKLFQAAAAYSGITSYIETGWGYTEKNAGAEEHAWNVIKLDEGHFAIDATWDDGNGSGGNDYRFFALGKSFFDSHSITKPDGDTDYHFIIKLPELNDEDYYPEQIVKNGSFTFKQDHGGMLTLKKYSGNGEKVTVPYIVSGNKVISIAENAFYENPSLKELTISSGIRLLEAYAVNSCVSLEKITFPDTIYCDPFSDSAYSGAWVSDCENLKEYSMKGDAEKHEYGISIVDGSVYSSDRSALILYPSGKTDTEFSIPDTVELIGAKAFDSNTHLEYLTVPEKCTAIGPYALTALKKLSDITVLGNNPAYYSKDGVLYQRDPKAVIAYSLNKNSGSLVIDEGTAEISDGAFIYARKLKQIFFPVSLSTFGDNVFGSDNFSDTNRLQLCFAGDLPDITDSSDVFSSIDLEITTHPDKSISRETKIRYESQCQSIIWKTGHIWGSWYSKEGSSHRERKCMVCGETGEEIPTVSVTLDKHNIELDSDIVDTITKISVKVEPENTTDILIWDLIGDDCLGFYEPESGVYLSEKKEGQGVLYAISGEQSDSCKIIAKKMDGNSESDDEGRDNKGEKDNPENGKENQPGNPSSQAEPDNEPRSLSVETVGDFSISYFHEIPFFGSAKLSVNDFGSITVSADNMSYNVNKIKVNKKKHRIQILGLDQANKKTVKDLKKATKGNNGLPFTIIPYYVKYTDTVYPKLKNNSLKSLKITLKGKKYKVKASEYEYSPDTGIITFYGGNLSGRYRIQDS